METNNDFKMLEIACQTIRTYCSKFGESCYGCRFNHIVECPAVSRSKIEDLIEKSKKEQESWIPF